MQQSAEHQLIDLAGRVERLKEQLNEARVELDELTARFLATETYKLAQAEYPGRSVREVPGYAAVVGPLAKSVHALRLEWSAWQAKLDEWSTGRLRVKGVKVSVVKGRRDVGLRGEVFWYGDSQWGTRVGIKTGEVGPDGKDVVHWNYVTNCNPLFTQEQWEAITR